MYTFSNQEPFPKIFVDSKEEGEQFSVISQAQMKKITKVFQREVRWRSLVYGIYRWRGRAIEMGGRGRAIEMGGIEMREGGQ